MTGSFSMAGLIQDGETEEIEGGSRVGLCERTEATADAVAVLFRPIDDYIEELFAVRLRNQLRVLAAKAEIEMPFFEFRFGHVRVQEDCFAGPRCLLVEGL